MKLFSFSHNSTKVQKTALSLLFQGRALAQSLQIFFFLQACLHPAQKQEYSVYLTVVNVVPEQDEH